MTAFDRDQCVVGAGKLCCRMISLEDCVALCGLTPEQVAAIAEHEHVPEIAAATLGRYLLDHPHGYENIRDMLIDDIRAAISSGNSGHARALVMALRHFLGAGEHLDGAAEGRPNQAVGKFSSTPVPSGS